VVASIAATAGSLSAGEQRRTIGDVSTIMQKTVDIAAVLGELYAPVQRELREAKVVFDRELACDLPFVEELCDTVRSYRGKMLRPALLLLSGRAVGTLSEAHLTLAAVVEMVHMATLVHDDVLDQADERRRQPTIGAIAGNEAAVLLGDFLISHAYHLCSSLDSQFASRRVAAATNTVCEGELLQNHYAGDFDLDEAHYFDIVRRKTGALTAVACELGAVFAGGIDATSDAMRRYGLHAGVAFQIIDDVLDFVGDEAAVGKTLGLDCMLGKPTLPLIHCLGTAPPESAGALRDMLRDQSGVERGHILEFLEQTGSIEAAVKVARAHTERAIACLDSLGESEARTSLESMAAFIIGRRF